MGPIGCPKTSGTNYESTPHNVPEERRSHLHRGGSLNSRITDYIRSVIIPYFAAFPICRPKLPGQSTAVRRHVKRRQVC
jgi:hypothetical protein